MALRAKEMGPNASELPALDRAAAQLFTFPEGRSTTFRAYQHVIAKHAIHQNTLVCLPTGFGKTLIAATVMHNFLRYFPTGRAVFLAPSRPLVVQQMDACCQLVGRCAKADALLLTGETPSCLRAGLWRQSAGRFLFCTPQTLENDLRNDIAAARSIVCVVVDEAHHASSTGYAYSQVIGLLESRGARFRILGLSATAGCNLSQVQRVVRALRIAHVECRLESDCELQAHSYAREVRVERVDVALRSWSSLREMVMHPVLDSWQRLTTAGVMPRVANVCDLGASELKRARSELGLLASRPAGLSSIFGAVNNLARLESDLALVACADNLDRALGQGLLESRTYEDCYSSLVGFKGEQHLNKKKKKRYVHTLELHGDNFDTGHVALDDCRKDCEPELHLESALERAASLDYPLERVEWVRNLHGMDERTILECIRIAPKVSRLQELLVEHFMRQKDSRVITFVSRRDTVAAICSFLGDSGGTVRAAALVGQSRVGSSDSTALCGAALQGMDRAHQSQVLAKFKDGGYNVLVSTSVAEEGIDIGSVDLIVCFDPVASPIRLVQRFGRTGRARDGSCVLMLTLAQEREYKETRLAADNLADALDRDGSLELASVRDSLCLPSGVVDNMRCHFFDPDVCMEEAVESRRASEAANRERVLEWNMSGCFKLRKGKLVRKRASGTDMTRLNFGMEDDGPNTTAIESGRRLSAAYRWRSAVEKSGGNEENLCSNSVGELHKI